jgi:hypothetical protein
LILKVGGHRPPLHFNFFTASKPFRIASGEAVGHQQVRRSYFRHE